MLPSPASCLARYRPSKNRLRRGCSPALRGGSSGEWFAIDGDTLPSPAAREWPGTREELGKQQKNGEALMGKLIERHVQLDKEAA
ncbi:MAG: hypothetical protein LBB80_11005 [Treponema sp.]|nr:hypothetical protein [Treponema sp.]